MNNIPVGYVYYNMMFVYHCNGEIFRVIREGQTFRIEVLQKPSGATQQMSVAACS